MNRKNTRQRPRLPPKVVAKIVGYLLPELQSDNEARMLCKATLYACTLVSRFWHALAMPWLFYDLSFAPRIAKRRHRRSIFKSILKNMYPGDASLATLHYDLKCFPNLPRYVRRLRLPGGRDASGLRLLHLQASCLVDVVHRIHRLDTLVLQDVIVHGSLYNASRAKKSLDCLWLTSDRGQSGGAWRITDLQDALRVIFRFASIRELRLSAPLNDVGKVPQESDYRGGDPPSVSVESIVVEGARLNGENTLQPNWPRAYLALPRILGDAVPLQDTRSVAIVNIINEGVLGLLHDDLERLRWSFCLEGRLYRAPGAFFNQKLPQIPPCKGLREVAFGLRIQQGTKVLGHIVSQIVMNVLNAVCNQSSAHARGLREVVFELTFDDVEEWDMHLQSHVFREVDRMLVRISELCAALGAIYVEFNVVGKKLPPGEYERAIVGWFPGVVEKGKLRFRTKTHRW